MKCGICKNALEGEGHPKKLFGMDVKICDACKAKEATHRVELCDGKATWVPRGTATSVSSTVCETH